MSDILPIAKKQERQKSIFDLVEAPLDWESEWWGMPEFVMGNTEPERKITISFECAADVEEFARRLGLEVTSRTDSLWFPAQKDYVAPKSLRWVDG